jgi:hypothetical protein
MDVLLLESEAGNDVCSNLVSISKSAIVVILLVFDAIIFYFFKKFPQQHARIT